MYHIYPYIKYNPTMYSPNPYWERQAESLESLFEAVIQVIYGNILWWDQEKWRNYRVNMDVYWIYTGYIVSIYGCLLDIEWVTQMGIYYINYRYELYCCQLIGTRNEQKWMNESVTKGTYSEIIFFKGSHTANFSRIGMMQMSMCAVSSCGTLP